MDGFKFTRGFIVIAKQSDKTRKAKIFCDANVLGFSTGGYINEDTKSLFYSWTDLNKVENTDSITPICKSYGC